MNFPQPIHVRLVRVFQRFRWGVLIGMRYGAGRWYLFRDAPDWYVNEVIAWNDEAEKDTHGMRNCVLEARAEMSRRFNNLIRAKART